MAPVWVSFPRLPIHFFEKGSLFQIASLVGLPLRLDAATVSLKRPSVARLQVEIDLLKPRPQQVWIGIGESDGFWQKVDYANVPDYCTHCWHIGHAEALCTVHHPELKAVSKQPMAARATKTKSVYVPKQPSESVPVASELVPSEFGEPVSQPASVALGLAANPEQSSPVPEPVAPSVSALPVVSPLLPPVDEAAGMGGAVSPILQSREIGFSPMPVDFSSEEEELIEIVEPDLQQSWDAAYPFLLPTEIRDDFCLKGHHKPHHPLGNFSDSRPPRPMVSMADQLQSLRDFHQKLQILLPSPSLPPLSAELVEVPLSVGEVVVSAPEQGPVVPTVKKRGRPRKNPPQSSTIFATSVLPDSNV